MLLVTVLTRGPAPLEAVPTVTASISELDALREAASRPRNARTVEPLGPG